MTPSGPISSRSWPAARPRAGWPSTQKSWTSVPAPTATLGNKRELSMVKLHGLGEPLEDGNDLQPLAPVGQRRAALVDAVGELVHLDGEGLPHIDVRQPDVAG